MTLIRKGDNTTINYDKYPDVISKDAEIQVVDLKIGHMKKMLVLNCYRPPSGKIESFFDHLFNTLDAIPKIDEYECYICGDFNIPYNLVSSPGYKKLKILEHKYNLTQYINTPTRCTSFTQSILDLIFTNSTCIDASGTLEVNMRYHEPVFVIRKHLRPKPTLVNFRCRTFNNYIKENFQEDLVNHDWSDYYGTDCVNQLWDILDSAIRFYADIHCP